MQFYRDGYRPGDPDNRVAAPQAVTRGPGLSDEVDVLIVGTGPAGTVLAAQLAAFPDITTRIIERRPEPLQVGQADGVACRTVEMFQAFGLAEALLREAYWVNEVRFWAPSDDDRSKITRTGWVDDTPAGLSEFPHVIVNQARMQQFLLDHAARSASKLSVDYGLEFVDYENEGEGSSHPLVVRLRDHHGLESSIRARYVVGCDGARSTVRRALGIELRGDAANHAWGVIDVLATTDFPDWRTKNVIQSDGKGSLLMIPREGGNMVRCYVDLGSVEDGNRDIRATSAEELARVAGEILHPYSFDVAQVVWSSVYEVGQRVADRFDDLDGDRAASAPRVFVAGDACHTHSAKAGQGMNVSMQDAFNLGWKLAAVLRGCADSTLLRTYSDERAAIAADLIAFDRHWSSFIAQPAADPAHPERGGVSPAEMQEEFARQGRYTAGLATQYAPSALIGDAAHQDLATGFPIGARFHSAPVRRVADARPLQLGHSHTADGRWRIYAFGDDGGEGLRDFAERIGAASDSPVASFTPASADRDSVIDVHAVFRGSHHDIDVTALPEILLPKTGELGLQDWEKAWAADADDDIFAERGISLAGAVVIVRPDQYVGHVLPLSARKQLTDYFGGFLLPA